MEIYYSYSRRGGLSTKMSKKYSWYRDVHA